MARLKHGKDGTDRHALQNSNCAEGIVVIDPTGGEARPGLKRTTATMRSGHKRHDPRQAFVPITSQEWLAGTGIEPPSRDFRGRGGFAVCCPRGHARDG